MDYEGIIIYYTYESEPEKSFKCKSNEKTKNVCHAIASKVKKNIKSISFLFNGTIITKSDYDQPINKFENSSNKGELHILVNSVEDSNSEEEKEISIKFWFKNNPTVINSYNNIKMSNIAKKFADKVGQDLNSLKFKYREKNLDLNKNFEENANQYDKNRGIMEITVEEYNIIQRSKFLPPISTNRQILQNQQPNLIVEPFQPNPGMFIIQPSPTYQSQQIISSIPNMQTRSSIDNIQITRQIEESCWKRNCKAIVISTIITILIIVGIIILIVIFNNDSTNFQTRDNRCEKYSDSSSNAECIKCKSDFSLYKGKCIFYAFIADYHVNFYNEKIQIFNPEKTKNEIIAWIREYFEKNGPGCAAVVGVSGGKDSLVLLAALRDFQRFGLLEYSLVGITLDPQFNGERTDFSPVADYCAFAEVFTPKPCVGGLAHSRLRRKQISAAVDDQGGGVEQHDAARYRLAHENRREQKVFGRTDSRAFDHLFLQVFELLVRNRQTYISFALSLILKGLGELDGFIVPRFKFGHQTGYKAPHEKSLSVGTRNSEIYHRSSLSTQVIVELQLLTASSTGTVMITSALAESPLALKETAVAVIVTVERNSCESSEPPSD